MHHSHRLSPFLSRPVTFQCLKLFPKRGRLLMLLALLGGVPYLIGFLGVWLLIPDVHILQGNMIFHHRAILFWIIGYEILAFAVLLYILHVGIRSRFRRF